MILVEGVEGSNSKLMRDTIPKFVQRDEEKDETPSPHSREPLFRPEIELGTTEKKARTVKSEYYFSVSSLRKAKNVRSFVSKEAHFKITGLKKPMTFIYMYTINISFVHLNKSMEECP